MRAPYRGAMRVRLMKGVARRKTQTYGVVPCGTQAPLGAPHALK